jgi:hypothetical protein
MGGRHGTRHLGHGRYEDVLWIEIAYKSCLGVFILLAFCTGGGWWTDAISTVRQPEEV